MGYAAGETTPQRLRGYECHENTCYYDFTKAYTSKDFNLEDVELEVLSGPNGVRKVVERFGGDDTDVHVLGGWMEHSLFVSQVDRLTREADPRRGAVRVHTDIFGFTTVENPTVPAGGASWQGFVVGRDDSVTQDIEAVVEGEANVFVELGSPQTLRANIVFMNLTGSHTQRSYDDIAWSDLPVMEGGFARRVAEDDTITGQFFGPAQEEVAGIFERSGISGVFGGLRQ